MAKHSEPLPPPGCRGHGTRGPSSARVRSGATGWASASALTPGGAITDRHEAASARRADRTELPAPEYRRMRIASKVVAQPGAS